MYSLDGVTHVKAAATFTEGVSPSLLLKWLHFGPEGVIQAGLVLCQEYVPEKVMPIKIAQIKHKFPKENGLLPGGLGIDNLILFSI